MEEQKQAIARKEVEVKEKLKKLAKQDKEDALRRQKNEKVSC